MATSYVVKDDGSTIPMQRVHCVNENKELQLVLEKNLDLLPGDQINPDDPCRWLQIAREMPVPDPSTVENRWSVDFFLSDQNAIPTFIECKRFNDTRSRREVVGQMFEYAANGHQYWDREEMRELAQITAEKQNCQLDEVLRQLIPNDEISVDEYFGRVEANLREGQLRLIFYLEEAPRELKSIVDFLNKQMERTEVLLVEVVQYRFEGITTVMPTLFGYTEEARLVKKKTVTISSGDRRKWDYESFFEDAVKKLSDSQVKSIKRLYDECVLLAGAISWGTGKISGSIIVKWPASGNKTVMSIYSDGRMEIPFGSLKGSETAEHFREAFKELLVKRLNYNIPEDYKDKYPKYRIDQWAPELDEFIQILHELLSD